MQTEASVQRPASLARDPTLPPLLTSGWTAFDELGLVRPGRTLLFDLGAPAGHDLCRGLLAHASASGAGAVVVDGANWMDLYRLGEVAKARRIARDVVLHGVRVARGFTAHQLQSLVEDALPQALAERPASLVLVPGLPEMYLDEDVRRDEARALLARALRALRGLAREHAVPVVVTNSTLAPGARHALRRVLDEGADEAVGLHPAARDGLRIAVPGRGMVVLASSPRAVQRRLHEFAPGILAARGGVGGFHARGPHPLKYAPKRAGELRVRQRYQALAQGA